nr:hypothetical protein BaRGS_031220 [Batillaria attramentaria]
MPTIRDYMPDPDDCGKFWRCANKKSYQFTCPAGLHFNTINSVCDWPENVDCDDGGGGGTTYYYYNDDDDDGGGDDYDGSYGYDDDTRYPYQPGSYEDDQHYYTERPRVQTTRAPVHRPVVTKRPVYRPSSNDDDDDDDDYDDHYYSGGQGGASSSIDSSEDHDDDSVHRGGVVVVVALAVAGPEMATTVFLDQAVEMEALTAVLDRAAEAAVDSGKATTVVLGQAAELVVDSEKSTWVALDQAAEAAAEVEASVVLVAAEAVVDSDKVTSVVLGADTSRPGHDNRINHTHDRNHNGNHNHDSINNHNHRL